MGSFDSELETGLFNGDLSRLARLSLVAISVVLFAKSIGEALVFVSVVFYVDRVAQQATIATTTEGVTAAHPLRVAAAAPEAGAGVEDPEYAYS